MCTHLRFNLKKTTQAINFLAIKSGGQINKIKAIKLIYFADRFHLRKYGRPITNDEYWAMEWGPVNSNAKDIADMNEEYLGASERVYISQYIKKPASNFVKSIKEVDKKIFSKSDIEALTWSWDTFGHFDGFALSDISHEYPEWKKFEAIIKSKEQTRVRMNYEDFFDDPGEKFEKCCALSSEEKEDRIDTLNELDKLSSYR